MPLVRTSAGAWLNADAAAAYEALNVAFTNRFGKRLSINSGARTKAQQEQLLRENYNPYPTNYAPGRTDRRGPYKGTFWWRKPGGVVVAIPGTSNHEYSPGKAADFGSGVANANSAEHAWMRANAGSYGWEWTGRNFGEPWHWEKNFTWSGGGSLPFPTPEEDDFMSALSESDQLDLYNHVKFISSQMNLQVASDRPAEQQAATALKRITEILFAVDGRADPTVLGADGKPVTRALAAFLQRENVPSADVIDIDEEQVARLVVEQLSADVDRLAAAISALPEETVAALKAAL